MPPPKSSIVTSQTIRNVQKSRTRVYRVTALAPARALKLGRDGVVLVEDDQVVPGVDLATSL